MKKILVMFSFLVGILYSQTLLWDYYYEGTGGWTDYAGKIIYGSDGNIYACGTTCEAPYQYDFTFTVMSYDTMGNLRWQYIKNTVNNSGDEAVYITEGGDGNLYVCGSIAGKLAVVSLTKDGNERWVYQTNEDGFANAEIVWFDGNVYTCGYIYPAGSSTADIYVLSLTSDGNFRWDYIYTNPDYSDQAHALAVDSLNGNIYVAGELLAPGVIQTQHFLFVVALSTQGYEKWTYIYDDPSFDDLKSGETIVTDGNKVYVGGAYGQDALVVALDIAGNYLWEDYEDFDSHISAQDNMIIGSDGNLYVASGDGHLNSVYIYSLTPDGSLRWVNNIASSMASFKGVSLTEGVDGDIYATCIVQAQGYQIPVIRIAKTGILKYTYLYPARNGGDWGMSITAGDNGKIYACGWSANPQSYNNKDWVVFGIHPALDVKENNTIKFTDKFIITYTVSHSKLSLNIDSPNSGRVDFRIYDPAGRILSSESKILSAGKNKIFLKIDPQNAPLFITAEYRGKTYKNKIIFLK
jgi:hypothetical protein